MAVSGYQRQVNPPAFSGKAQPPWYHRPGMVAGAMGQFAKAVSMISLDVLQNIKATEIKAELASTEGAIDEEYVKFHYGLSADKTISPTEYPARLDKFVEDTHKSYLKRLKHNESKEQITNWLARKKADWAASVGALGFEISHKNNLAQIKKLELDALQTGDPKEYYRAVARYYPKEIADLMAESFKVELEELQQAQAKLAKQQLAIDLRKQFVNKMADGTDSIEWLKANQAGFEGSNYERFIKYEMEKEKISVELKNEAVQDAYLKIQSGDISDDEQINLLLAEKKFDTSKAEWLKARLRDKKLHDISAQLVQADLENDAMDVYQGKISREGFEKKVIEAATNRYIQPQAVNTYLANLDKEIAGYKAKTISDVITGLRARIVGASDEDFLTQLAQVKEAGIKALLIDDRKVAVDNLTLAVAEIREYERANPEATVQDLEAAGVLVLKRAKIRTEDDVRKLTEQREVKAKKQLKRTEKDTNLVFLEDKDGNRFTIETWEKDEAIKMGYKVVGGK